MEYIVIYYGTNSCTVHKGMCEDTLVTQLQLIVTKIAGLGQLNPAKNNPIESWLLLRFGGLCLLYTTIYNPHIYVIGQCHYPTIVG